MPKQFRDVSGGSQVWGSMIPGYGFANYLLGIISVPIETFLRRDFGERYYTKANFIAGLVILFIFKSFMGLLNMLNPLSFLRGGGGEEPASWLGKILTWYFFLGIAHFVTIWVRDVTGTPRHSFDSGKSWLLIVGRSIIWIMNKIVGLFVRIIAGFLPGIYKQRLLATLPIFRDVAVFTERFIEPGFVFFLMVFAAANGQPATAMWLALSFGALNLATGQRHQQEREFMLDIRDQLIESRVWQDITEGKQTKQVPRLQRTFNETMSEVEKSPEVLETIAEEQPAVARAIAAVRARQRNAHFPAAESMSEPTQEAI